MIVGFAVTYEATALLFCLRTPLFFYCVGRVSAFAAIHAACLGVLSAISCALPLRVWRREAITIGVLTGLATNAVDRWYWELERRLGFSGVFFVIPFAIAIVIVLLVFLLRHFTEQRHKTLVAP